MAKRKPISNRTRFEIFKRDSFKCQYCGASAPEAILHVDHIHPVASGGDNSITNLITSCSICNGGKGAKKLDDNTEVKKQKAMLDELNQRREQLEMMVKWRKWLKSIDDDKLQIAVDYITDAFETTYEVNDNGKAKVKAWLRKFNLDEVFRATDICAAQYLRLKNGDITQESWNKAFEYIPRVVYGSRLEQENPLKSQAIRIRGRLRHVFSYVDEWGSISLIENLLRANLDGDSIVSFAKQSRHWTDFRNKSESFLKEYEDGI